MLVYIHGGYWQELSKTLSAYLVGPLHAAGFKVLVLEYELCPKITLTKLVSQICKAAEYINEYAEKKGSRYKDGLFTRNSTTEILYIYRNVSYAGHSAGAHLIQCMIDQLLRTASNSYNRLHSLFLISGVYDLRDLRETSINCNNMLSLSDDNVLSLSPAMFDYSGWPSNLNVEIFVGQNDSPTFITQSKNLHNLLQDTSKLHSTYTIVPDCDHFELVELLSSPTYQITKSILAITQ